MPKRWAMILGALTFCAMPLAADDAAKKSRPVYEMRTYTAAPGKTADMHKRFREHTLRLFEKHNMKNVGYWVPVDKPDMLVYILAHPSRDAAKESWKAFIDDPDWQRAHQASEVNGKLVAKVQSVYMNATDYSPIK